MRETIHINGKRAPDNLVHQNPDSPPRGPERHSNCNAVGEKDSHLHCASVVRAERDREGNSGMAGLNRGCARRRTTIGEKFGRNRRGHRSLSEEASWDRWAPEKPKHIMSGCSRTMTEFTEAHNTITSQFTAAAPEESGRGQRQGRRCAFFHPARHLTPPGIFDELTTSVGCL